LPLNIASKVYVQWMMIALWFAKLYVSGSRLGELKLHPTVHPAH